MVQRNVVPLKGRVIIRLQEYRYLVMNNMVICRTMTQVGSTLILEEH